MLNVLPFPVSDFGQIAYVLLSKNKSAVICRIRVICVSLSTFVKKQEKAILERGNKIGGLATGAESTRYDMVIPRHKTDAKKT